MGPLPPVAPQQVPLQAPEPAEEPSEFDQMPWYAKGLDLIARTGYASAGFAHSLVTGGNPIQGAWDGLLGRERKNYSDVLGAVGFDHGLARAALGFGMDVALDPLSYVGIGAGKGAGKIAFGAETKTLTEAGQGVRTAMEAEKLVHARQLLGAFDATDNAAVRGQILERFGLGAKAALPDETIAKLMSERATAEEFYRYSRGAQPAAEELLPQEARELARPLTAPSAQLEALQPQQVFEPRAIRFLDQPLVNLEPALQAGKQALQKVEDLRGIGPVVRGVRQSGEDVGKWLKGLFSTDTGDSWLNSTMTDARDKLDFDTYRIFDDWVGKNGIGRDLIDLRKTDPARAKMVEDQVRGALQGISDIKTRQIPDAEKLKLVDSKLGLMKTQLQELYGTGEKNLAAHTAALQAAETGIKAKGQEYAQAVGEHQAAIEQAAGAEAKKQTAEMRGAHQAEFGDIVKELKDRGIGPIAGISGQEYRENIPKAMRRLKGQPMDEWIDELKRRMPMYFPENADQEHLYDFLKLATSKPGEVAPEAVRAGVQAPKEAARLKVIEDEVAALRKQKAALEAKPNPAGVDVAKAKTYEKNIERLEKVKAAWKENPPLKGEEYKVLREPTDPLAKEITERMKGRFQQMLEAEQKLPLPPQRMENYFPHIANENLNPAIRKLIRQDAYKVLTREFSGNLNAAQRRSYQGLVDELTVQHLIDEGHIDPHLLDAELKRQGIKVTPDQMLFFETDPIKAGIARELKSVRTLNAADMTREILSSPQFVAGKVALKDKDALIELLKRNPGHTAFLPTKDYIDRFLTPSEREALKHGAQPELRSSFIKDLGEILRNAKNDIEGKPERELAQAYIVKNEVAQHLSKAYSSQFSTEATKQFLKVYDRVTSYWKTFQTLPNPGFYVRNAVSYVWQAGILAGANNPKTWQKSIMALRNPEAVENFGKYTAKEALDIAERHAIVRGGFVGREIGESIERLTNPSNNPLSLRGPIARKGGDLVQSIDNAARFALFADGLEKGMDVQSAINRTKLYLFDYNDLTKTEKTFFKRLIPFYTWTRKSIPVGLMSAVQQPGKVAAIKKIQGEAESNVPGALENRQVAEWIRDSMGVPIKKNDDGTVSYFLMGNWIPTMDVAKLDPREILSSVHPAIKIPLEQWLNQNLYTGKPLERFPGELQKVLGVPMTGRVAELVRNVGFAQQFDRHFFKDDLDAVDTPLSVLGFRTYAQDKAKQLQSSLLEVNHEIGQMRRAEADARAKYGDDSRITLQYTQRLADLAKEQENLHNNLQQVQPQANASDPNKLISGARRSQPRGAQQGRSPASALMKKVHHVGRMNPKIEKILGGRR